MIQQAICSAEDRLNPATDREIASAVAILLRHAATFEIKADAKLITEAYRQMCATMPPDLLAKGLDAVLARWTDAYRLPMPGHVWDAVREDYGHRKVQLARLEAANIRGNLSGFPEAGIARESEADRMAGIDELLTETRRILSAATDHMKGKL